MNATEAGAGPAFRQARETAQALMAEGRQEEAFDVLLSALAPVLEKSRELELLLARMRRVGRSSERIDPGQLALLSEELLEQLGGEPEAPDPDAEAREDAEPERQIEEAEKARQDKNGSEPSTFLRPLL